MKIVVRHTRKKEGKVNYEKPAHLPVRPELAVRRHGQVGLQNLGLHHPVQQHLCHGCASSSSSCSPAPLYYQLGSTAGLRLFRGDSSTYILVSDQARMQSMLRSQVLSMVGQLNFLALFHSLPSLKNNSEDCSRRLLKGIDARDRS